MGKVTCPYCKGEAKRFGKTAAGSQRWRCSICKATFTKKIDNSAKLLREFVKWLMSRKRECDMPGDGRTFRRKMKPFWEIWPLPPLIDEIHHVVYVDALHFGRKATILIARGEDYVLGWYLSRSENSRAYGALLSRIAPPDMVVTDGGSGFEKARKRTWPKTKVQRCTFHVASQIRRYTTSRPRLLAGVELLGISRVLLKVEDTEQAALWLVSFSEWCIRWEDFLNEQSFIDGRYVYTHERLIKARNSLTILIRQNTLFTYLDPDLEGEVPLPSTNNKIEGGVNSQLRQMLRDHRGLSLMRRIKAVFWWCYMHTEFPLPPAEILKIMPTDQDIEAIYQELSDSQRVGDSIPQWGDSIVWGDLHHSAPYRMDWD